MKRTVPLLITATAGFVLIVSFFLPTLQWMGEFATVCFDILASFAFILGGGNLLKLHLKSISDQKPGWGYSGVTIVAFVVTLLFGLLKIGSPSTPNVEYYGEVFVHFPLADMPESRISGSLPKRADGAPLPTSVRMQLREEVGKNEIVFQGWMTEDQKEDLLQYKESLDWRCRVEQLFAATQPTSLGGKVKYYPKYQALAVQGVLTEELRDKLAGALPVSPVSTNAIEGLFQRSHQPTTIATSAFPASFEIPPEAASYLKKYGPELTVVGPVSPQLKDLIALKWAGFAPAMPLTDEQELELRRQIEDLGDQLTLYQYDAFTKFFAAEWKADALVAAINTAGILPPEEKTACELLEEQRAQTEELLLHRPAPEPSLLNADQVQAVEVFVEQPGQSAEELIAQLISAGSLTERQKSSISRFLDQLPRQADVQKSLGIELLRTGPLNSAQRNFLFQPAAEQYLWKVAVSELTRKSHQVKYPWSGDFSAQGNPFWWIYEFVMQPLMTTTFAVLAFYVASAAFRAFRAKNLEATLLLVTAFIVLLGRTYVGVSLTAWVPDAFSALKIDQMTVYIMKIFNTAGNRAIMIGIALGIASTSLKILLGIDRSYLGSGDD